MGLELPSTTPNNPASVAGVAYTWLWYTHGIMMDNFEQVQARIENGHRHVNRGK
jgi:hypothetical protein